MKQRIHKYIAVILLVCLVFNVAPPSYAADGSQSYTIQADCNTGGSISPAGKASLVVGQSQTYTITPEYGYVIKDVLVDEVSKGALSSYTFDNIDENHTISVVFARRSGDLNDNGVCDEDDVAILREALVSANTYNETMDTNCDNEMNAVDLVRALRQKTLWGNTFEHVEEWTSYNSDVLQFSESSATFSGSTSALSAKNFGSNYSVSMNMIIESTTNSKSASVGIMARRTKSTYYDYRLFYVNGAFELRLSRYGTDGSVVLLKTYTATQIQNVIGYRALAFGEEIQLRLTCHDDYLYCYVDNCLIGSYQDVDAVAPKSGSAGVKMYNAIGSFYGFEVQSELAVSLDKVNSDELNDGKLELYEGGSMYQGMETIHGICIDGTVLTADFQHATVSEYDSKKQGEQKLTVSLYDSKVPMTLRVKERRNEIAQISDALETNVTEEAMQQYHMLSEYERTLCSKQAVSNYEAAVQAKTLAISREDDEILVKDSYDTNIQTWNSGVEIQRGKAFKDDGRYCIEQTAYGVSGNCWRTIDDFKGEIHTVSADMMATSVYTATGLSLNVGETGYYYARVMFSVNKSGKNAEPTLRLYRKASDTIQLARVNLNQAGIYLSPGKWFHMSITCNDGILCVYLNGTKLIEYDDSNSVEQFLCGSAGVYSYAGNSRFDNFVVSGTPVVETESPMKPTTTIYTNDFEQEEVGKSSDDWMHSNTALAWKVADNHSYGVEAREYTDATLHVHEKNPNLSLDFRYQELANADACFGFEIRKSLESAYVRIGYDNATGKWYLRESVCDADCDVFEYECAGTLSENSWHRAEIMAEGAHVFFAVDGQTIFDLTAISQTGYGKISVYAEGAEFYIDNVSCEFPSGATVQSGVLEYYLNDYDDYAASFEIESLDGGNMIGVGYNVIALSDDYGATFTKVTDEKYADLDAGGAYSSMIQLHDGNYLFIKQNDFKVLRSDGDMTKWKHIGNVIPESDMKDDKGRRSAIIHVNSLTEVQLDDGTWRIFLPVGRAMYDSNVSSDVSDHYTMIYYSDDGGQTWVSSVNDTREVALLPEGQTNADWCEAKILKCSDGTLRMYCSRNEYGSMLYSVSEDGGQTWGRMYPVPELQCAKSSFSIIEDGSGSGVYYMVWVNDNPNIVGGIVARSRLSLARSTDGKNWEFLCDIERNNPYVWSNDLTVTSPIFQIVDPSIEVTEDYVYVSYGTSDRTLPHDNGFHNAQQIKVVRLDKSKLQARQWDAYTLSDTTYISTLTLPKQMDTTYSVGEEFSCIDEIEVTALDGTKKTVSAERFYLLSAPDMTTAGEKEIVLYNRNGFSVSYTITVGKPIWGEIF